jgi:hypothetical protein
MESGRHPSHCVSSKGPNYQHGVLLISAGAIEGHFEGKMPREVTKGEPLIMIANGRWDLIWCKMLH